MFQARFFKLAYCICNIFAKLQVIFVVNRNYFCFKVAKKRFIRASNSSSSSSNILKSFCFFLNFFLLLTQQLVRNIIKGCHVFLIFNFLTSLSKNYFFIFQVQLKVNIGFTKVHPQFQLQSTYCFCLKYIKTSCISISPTSNSVSVLVVLNTCDIIKPWQTQTSTNYRNVFF